MLGGPNISRSPIQWLKNAVHGVMRLARRVPWPRVPPAVTFAVSDAMPNAQWNRTNRGTRISIRRDPLITRDAKIFAMGSCFAVEVRNALRRGGWSVYPDYLSLQFDRTRHKIGLLPERDNVNHYDTFTMRQEFEMAFEGRRTSVSDFWSVRRAAANLPPELRGETLFQDPHRLETYASTAADLLELSSRIDHCIREGIVNADLYILTLGLIEAWRNKTNGRYLCHAPRSEHAPQAEFVLSDFDANLANLRRICSLIAAHRPGKKVVLTVSPVPLARTFTDQDVIVANMESKSLLRAVAGEITREFPFVKYWPSFEIATREDIYEPDGRHVTRTAVAKIVNAFLAAHVE